MAEKKTTAKTAPAPAVETVENPVNKMIDGLVEKAQAALKEFLTLDQEQIDHIVHEMALAGLDKHQELARMAVEETGRGVYEDKVIKNMFATEYIWHDIKKEKTVGVLDENEMEGYVEVAEPVGVIAGVTPTTNPTSTTLFKSLIDDRNIVITQHMKCFFQNVTAFLDRIVHITGRFHIQRNIIFMEVLDAEHLFFQCKVFVKICNVFFVGHDQNFVVECFINTVLKQTGLQGTVKMAGLGIEDLSFGIADQQIGKGIFHISVLFEIMLKCLSSHVHIFIAQKFMISCTV